MKKILSFLPFCLLLLLCSCDQISEDDRYVELPAVDVQRCVLLEEFTGQNCPNCPSAHRTIEALQEQYGDAFIPVSIHAGGFAIAEGEYEPYFQTFMTPEGDQYANNFGITAYPSGVINRNSGVKLHTEWATLVRSELERPTRLGISLSAEVIEDTLTVSYQLQPEATMQGNLQLWLLESNIVSIQTDGKDIITDYVHNNVYRASLNGVGGQPLALTSSVYHSGSASIKLRPDWNPQNLSVVAFYATDQGIEQAALLRLSSSQPAE